MLRITQYRCPRRIDCHQRTQQSVHFPGKRRLVRVAMCPQAQQFQLPGFYFKQQFWLPLRQRYSCAAVSSSSSSRSAISFLPYCSATRAISSRNNRRCRAVVMPGRVCIQPSAASTP